MLNRAALDALLVLSLFTVNAQAQESPTLPASDSVSIAIANEEKSSVSTTSSESISGDEKAPTAVATPTVAPDYPPLEVNIEGKPGRYGFINKLLEVSSGAKLVRASAVPEIMSIYGEARGFYQQATDAVELAQVNMYLNMAVGKMYRAIQLATPKKLSDDKSILDYEQRLKSVNALSDAYARIVEEKGLSEKGEIVLTQVAEHKQSASVLEDNKDFKAGRAELDVAYVLIKSAIELMRGGDTLIRSLNFASIEEEYHYEVDRNDTHFMLVNLLVAGKLESKPQSFKDKIAKMVVDAKAMKLEAEQLAKDEGFKHAITKLENSTGVLVKAIRMGGVFIPSA